MVFKEDMINKYLVITKVFLFYCFISSCSYKFENSESSNLENVKTISLNVNSLVINKNILGNKEQDFLIEEINRILIIKFEDWVYNKFKVIGEENTVNINVNQLNTVLKKTSNKKKIFSIFYDENRFAYNINFLFDINLQNYKGDNKKLKISSNTDLFTNNRLSISERGKLIRNTINRLIKKIDKNVDEQFKNVIFNEFVIAN